MNGRTHIALSIRTLLLTAGGILIGVLAIVPIAAQQAVDDTPQRIARVLPGLQTPDWQSRRDAFYDLFAIVVPGGLRGKTGPIAPAVADFLKTHPDLKDQVTTEVLHLLSRENDVIHSAAVGSLPEEFGVYHGDLVSASAAFNDAAATDALIGSIATGNMAGKALASHWTTSLDRVIVLLSTGDIGARIGATRTLGQMLNPAIANLDAAARAKVKAGLIRASTDSFFAVRDSAVSGLARLSDADVTAILKTIANNDPYSRVDDTSGARRYPVRETAQTALASR
jgi:hypothetical protein